MVSTQAFRRFSVIKLFSFLLLQIAVLALSLGTAAAQSVTSFTLVNADTDSDIGVINNGAVIDLNFLSTSNLNIRANTSPAVTGSVRFSFDGSNNFSTEGAAPYALVGDISGDYNAFTPSLGEHTLTATPFTGPNAGGTAGTPLTVGFTVIDSSTGGLAVAALVLVNADTDLDIGPLTDGAIIDLSQIGTDNLSVRADTTPAVVGSVRFGLDGNPKFQTESAAPYALKGDIDGDYTAVNFAPGEHTITATPYSQAGAKGEVGTAKVVTFTVIQGGGSPTISVTPASHDFGASDIGTPAAPLQVEIENTGSVAATVSSLQLSGSNTDDFSLNRTPPFDVAVGAVESVTVNFTPGAAGPRSAQLSIGSNAAGSPHTVNLSGSGNAVGGQQVVALILVNADTDQDIGPLSDGAEVNLADIGTSNLSIRAETSPSTVGSVRFAFDGTTNFHTENTAPYAFNGDISGDYTPFNFALGMHTVTATPFSGSSGGGTQGTALSASFTIVDESGGGGEAFARLNAGGPEVVTGGQTWSAANGIPPFINGKNFTVGTAIAATDDDVIYQSERSGNSAGNLYLAYPLPNGSYRVTLKFAELFFDNSGQRVFDVLIEDQTVLDDFDILAEVAKFTAVDKSFVASVADGVLSVDFLANRQLNADQGNRGKINAILIESLDGDASAVTAFVLVNADTDADIGPLLDGDTIDLSELPTANLNVRAVTSPAVVGSVLFGFDADSDFSVANAAPYALAGQTGGDYAGLNFSEGSHVITATPFSQAEASGVPGNSLTVNFTVVDGAVLETIARVNAGGPEYTDSTGELWTPSSAVSPGFFNTATGSTGNNIAGTPDPTLYQTHQRANNKGQMFFGLASGNGDFVVTLHFAETNTGATAGLRPFDIQLEEVVVEDDFDIFAEVGVLTAVQKSYAVTVADGQLSIDFVTSKALGAGETLTNNERPIVSAIQIDRVDTGGPNIQFNKKVFASSSTAGAQNLINPTSLQIGPDGRLYAAQQNGLIHVFSYDANHNVTAVQVITTIFNSPTFDNDGAPANCPEAVGRQVTGIFVDPLSSPSAPVLYLVHSDPRIGTNNDDSAQCIDIDGGVLTRLIGPDFDNPANRLDMVTGLPRSRENHSPNGLTIGTDGWLYISIGGNTNFGAPSQFFSNLPEVNLTAVVARLNLNAFTVPFNVSAGSQVGSGPGDGEIVGLFEVFADGYRNGYDLILHSNGKLYLNGNEGNSGIGNTPSAADGCPGVASINPQETVCGAGQPHSDKLFIVTQGAYGGHPHPARNHCIYNDGTFYTPDLPPDPAFTKEIFNYCGSVSTNGLAEYISFSAFQGAMLGDLLSVSTFGDDKVLRRLQLTPDGSGVLEETILASNLKGPIDVAVGADGAIFVAELFSGEIVVLEPIGGTANDNDGDGIPDASDPDDDNDGYSDADEQANGTSPFNPAQFPADFDGDFISNLLDDDDDNDGILDGVDSFIFDPANGEATVPPLFFEYNPGDTSLGGLRDTGFTGTTLSSNGGQFIAGKISTGAAGGFLAIGPTAGDLKGAANNQDNALQLGVNATPFSGIGPFTATAKAVEPFNNPPAPPLGAESEAVFLNIQTPPRYLETANKVVIEAESIQEPSGWTQKTSIAGFSGAGYIERTGAAHFDNPGVDEMVFRFRIQSAGNYRIRFRHRSLGTQTSGEPGNDCFVRFPTGNDVSGELPLNRQWVKLFAPQSSNWGWNTSAQLEDETTGIVVQNFAAGVHELRVSARSKFYGLDKIVLSKGVTFDDAAFTAFAESGTEQVSGEDNFLRLALTGDIGNGTTGIQLSSEFLGVHTANVVPALQLALPGPTNVELFLAVDPEAEIVEARYRIDSNDPEDIVTLGTLTRASHPAISALFTHGLGVGVVATHAGEAGSGFAAVFDYFRLLPGFSDTSIDNGATAFVEIDPGGSLFGSSTFNFDSLRIVNTSTSGQNISRLRIDLRTAFLPDVVFDPFGTGGDLISREFTPNAADAAASGLVAHGYFGSHQGGFYVVDASFNDFQPGEELKFAIDGDPTSIKGVKAPGPGEAGSISGLEMAGATATVFFEDGSTHTAQLFRSQPNSLVASEAIVAAQLPAKPTLKVLNVPVVPGVVTSANQTVRITGNPGDLVQILVAEGALFTAGLPGGGFDIDPFEANNLVKITQVNATIGAGGTVDVPIVLTKTAVSDDGQSGINHIFAVAKAPGGETGPLSQVAVLQFNP